MDICVHTSVQHLGLIFSYLNLRHFWSPRLLSVIGLEVAGDGNGWKQIGTLLQFKVTMENHRF